MGTNNFFRQVMDPAGMTFKALGLTNNPTAQRLASYVPGTDWGVTKTLAPTAYNAQAAYMARQRPAFQNGPYAGVTPTLADANSGYGEAAANAVGNAQKMVGVGTPPARATAQTVRPGQPNLYGDGGWNG